MRRRDADAHRSLADTALARNERMIVYLVGRALARERRKPTTIGTREQRSAAEVARDVFAERQQQLIEAGIWPVY